MSTGLKTHGYVGFIVLLSAEALLLAGNEFVGRWFTPIIWTGYLLFIDSLVFKARGRSLLVNDRSEFLIVAIISIANWWLFEFYNAPRFWRSDLELWWHYHNMEPNLMLRRIGYDWAFATISPAMFETAELLGISIFRTKSTGRQISISRPVLYSLIVVGAAGAVLPLIIVSWWLVPVVWLSFIFLFDPLNALGGRPSICGDLMKGRWRRLMALLVAGGVCGFLWEFWNYWALTKWTYTVPYLGSVKIFEMPILGYFGFPPFAIECWATYVFVRGWVVGARSWTSESICPVSTQQA